MEAKDILKIDQELDRLRCCILLLDGSYCLRYANRAALRALHARSERDLMPPGHAESAAAASQPAAGAPLPSSPEAGATAAAPLLESTAPLQQVEGRRSVATAHRLLAAAHAAGQLKGLVHSKKCTYLSTAAVPGLRQPPAHPAPSRDDPWSMAAGGGGRWAPPRAVQGPYGGPLAAHRQRSPHQLQGPGRQDHVAER